VTPGDRVDLPLEIEPSGFFHPLDAGTTSPRTLDARVPALEEEPALWPQARRPARPPLRQGRGR
jgi:hypothetical protein